MQKKNAAVVVLVILLALTTLACRFSMELPWNVGAQDVDISEEQVSAAATRAAGAAVAAATLVDQAGQLAATAVTQGDSVLATAIAEQPPAAPGSLQEKLLAVQPDTNGNFVFPITDEDLAAFFAAQGGSFNSGDAQMENLRVTTHPDAVVLNGDLTSPLKVSLTARFQPVVENGRLYFRALDASAGALPLPSSMLSLLEAGVNVGLGQALAALPTGVQVQDVQLGQGVFTITAR